MADRNEPPVIVWFRQDLRLGDNPALIAAAETGQPILPVYVLDDEGAGDWAIGSASRWWLHKSLTSLGRQLDGMLSCYTGRSADVVAQLAHDSGATCVFVNRCVEPWQAELDSRVEKRLAADGVAFECFLGSELFDAERILKEDGTPYRVFTPYYRRGCLKSDLQPAAPQPAPDTMQVVMVEDAGDVESLGLLPDIPWYGGLEAEWSAGEQGALDRLDTFLDGGLRGYGEGRDRPDLRNVSRLSPHLHFGEISPNQVWHTVLPLQSDASMAKDVDSFMSELGWREFSRYLLWHFPTLPEQNLQEKFDRFPWIDDEAALKRWQRGETGIPIVDAGMRELWQTGYMHNRVRMIVASLLVKNLLIDWREGERWFWDTLVDADLANNSAGWQWVAGSGADAAPYFRIFNPVTQGRKFDPNGDYVRRFVPELGDLSGDDLHEPWSAPARVRAPIDYPEPIVDLKESRRRALDAFASISGR